VTRPTALFFAMPQEGHFRRVLPLAQGLADGGVRSVFCTHGDFRTLVEQAGAEFFDLFERYPLDGLDEESFPRFLRYVTFADRYGAAIVRDLRELDPGLVVYDAAAVVGRFVASVMALPYVNVCWGHNLDPARLAQSIDSMEGITASPLCRDASKRLGERLGFSSGAPSTLLSALSPYLNIVCEPSAFLTPEQRRAFEPVDFYGSLTPNGRVPEVGAGALSAFPGDASRRRVLVSLGTTVWRYLPDEVISALRSIADALGSIENVSALITLGRAEFASELRRELSRPNVSVADWVDQWHLLPEADVFVTHHGLSGTHEAIYHRVPMISYPFGGDQSDLAEICRSLGVAIPLTEQVLAPVTTDAVYRALELLEREEQSMRTRLEAARKLELEAIEGRGAVNRRIVDLARR
jgi:UDP:flavonoid glycosyltransferase YjiC (YdhE family)